MTKADSKRGKVVLFLALWTTASAAKHGSGVEQHVLGMDVDSCVESIASVGDIGETNDQCRISPEQSSAAMDDAHQQWDEGRREKPVDAHNQTKTDIPSDELTVQPPACFDRNEKCSRWAASGECEKNSEWMFRNCRKSCSMRCNANLGSDDQSTDESSQAKWTNAREKGHKACIDSDRMCPSWADSGECEENPFWMLSNCRKSCSRICLGSIATTRITEGREKPFRDDYEKCTIWASQGACQSDSTWMRSHCRRSCSVCVRIESEIDFGERQGIPRDSSRSKVRAIIDESIAYMRDDVMKKDEYETVRFLCRNKDRRCSHWAAMGRCEDDPVFMHQNCSPACRSCEMMDYKNRCPFDPDAQGALKPGGINAMFGKITSSPDFATYKPVVLSRPDNSHETNYDIANTEKGPWVVSFDEFLTDEECDRLVAIGHEQGFKRSVTGGAANQRKAHPDGRHEKVVDEYRTSENTWCWEKCSDDPLVRRVVERISTITGIPEENSEFLQLLRYEKGQYYRRHGDYIAADRKKQRGVRVLTFFLYLSDVEAGGGTKFAHFEDLTVMPKKGRAVVWPNVLDDDPNEKDPRTDHEALIVERGIKYGANAWFHMHDFKGSVENGC